MIEPLFSSPPVWSGSTPWPGTWFQPPSGAIPMLPSPQNPIAQIGIAPVMPPASSAPMLVAAVAMNRGPQGPTNDGDSQRQ